MLERRNNIAKETWRHFSICACSVGSRHKRPKLSVYSSSSRSAAAGCARPWNSGARPSAPERMGALAAVCYRQQEVCLSAFVNFCMDSDEFWCMLITCLWMLTHAGENMECVLPLQGTGCRTLADFHYVFGDVDDCLIILKTVWLLLWWFRRLVDEFVNLLTMF